MKDETNEGRTRETDRRGFLQCMAWTGTGLVWTLSGGILSSRAFAAMERSSAETAGDLHFVQISDTHIGFNKAANPNPLSSARAAVRRVNALADRPAFLLHTGDLTHSQKPGEFDVVAGLLREARVDGVFTVPGEHDVFEDDGKEYRARFGGGTLGGGWQSFDARGAHFVGLVNVLSFRSGGVGRLGAEQLQWLRKDLEGLAASTPIVVFAHIPLWAVYPEWGWVTDDGEQALALLRRFGSVTVLNGHIHQVLQKVEGSITFHTAFSTAYPQPAPGVGPGPGPLRVPAGQLPSLLGVREVTWRGGPGPLAIVDSRLG
jgi:3',5'-cyclic-AMP phosphodiesterase